MTTSHAETCFMLLWHEVKFLAKNWHALVVGKHACALLMLQDQSAVSNVA